MPNANSVPSGIPGSGTSVPPVTTGNQGGQAVQAGSSDFVPKAQYDALETKLGTMGNEVGDLRGYKEFYEQIQPLLVKLEQNPEVVTAIINGQIDSGLAKAVLDGRVNVTDAAAVAQAHTTVKDKLGKEGYEAANPDAIAKLVEAEAQKIRAELASERDMRDFETSTQRFIASTPDFEKYMPAIDKWLDEHDVTDISVAYYAVKGQLSEKEAKDAAEVAAADRAKDVMSNASGGGVTAQYAPDGRPIVDTLIGSHSSPNSIF